MAPLNKALFGVIFDLIAGGILLIMSLPIDCTVGLAIYAFAVANKHEAPNLSWSILPASIRFSGLSFKNCGCILVLPVACAAAVDESTMATTYRLAEKLTAY